MAAPAGAAAAVLALQRSAGNAAVRKLLRAPPGGWDAFKLEEERKKFVERLKAASAKSVESAWRDYLLGLSDTRDDNRAWPEDAERDPHPLKLRILAFQRGEQFIHALAMILEPASKVEIIYDVESKYELYRLEGAAEGLAGGEAVHHTYKRLHGQTSSQSAAESTLALQSRALADALAIRRYLLDLGIQPERIAICGVKSTRQLKDQNPNRATNIVTEHMRRNPQEVRRRLKVRLPRSLVTQGRVRATLKDSKLPAGGQCVLLWVRATGRNPGGAPEFDTPEQFLVDIAKRLHRDSHGARTICLIGDKPPGRTVQVLRDSGVPVNTYLVEYWKHHRLTYPEQLQFLWTLHNHARCVAIGIESGILELPAVLGMPTIYLEPASVREKKGNRWRDFWSTFGRTGATQQRAMLPIARLLFTTSHLGYADVTTGVDLLERCTVATTARIPKDQPVKELIAELEKTPEDPQRIVEKWTAIKELLKRVMRSRKGKKLELPAEKRDAALQTSIHELTLLSLHAEELERISRLVDVMSPLASRLPERPSAEERPNVEALVEPTASWASGAPPWGARRRPPISQTANALLDPRR